MPEAPACRTRRREACRARAWSSAPLRSRFSFEHDLFHALEPEQLRRVMDQHEAARFFVGRDLSNEIDQFAVVRYRLVVRMRPIGAPDHALRRVRSKIARKRHGV